jgi:hypothetical protein
MTRNHDGATRSMMLMIRSTECMASICRISFTALIAVIRSIECSNPVINATIPIA